MRLQTSILAAAVLSLSAPLAFADVITQTAVVPTTVTDWNSVFDFNQFNPALGILTSVSAVIDDGWQSSGTLTNISASTQKFYFELTTKIGVAGGPLSAFGTALTNTYTSGLVRYSSLASGATAAVGPFGPSANTASYSTTLSSDLGAFEGAGTFSVTLDTATLQTLAGAGGNIQADLATYANETLNLTYTYTYTPETVPVPEPGELALLGSGLFGLGLVRRRRA